MLGRSLVRSGELKYLTILLVSLTSCIREGPTPTADERVLDPPVCPNCRVRFQPVLTLGDSRDPISINGEAALERCRISRLSSGQFITSAATGGGELVVYDGTGRVTRSIGRRGQGPGELLGTPLLIVGPGDTLNLVDNENGRLQVLTPDGRHVRSFRFPTRISAAALLSDGSYVLVPSWTAIRDVGQPLFTVYARDGALIQKVGSFDGVQVDWGQDWIVSPAYPTGFWEGKESRFRANRWSVDGTLQESIIRDAEWFPEDPELDVDFPASAAPGPLLYHLRQDRHNYLWLFLVDVAGKWTPPPEEEGESSVLWVNEVFETRTEVVDLEQRRLIASGVSDLVLMPMCDSRFMYAVVEAEDGDTRVQVVEPILEGGGRAGHPARQHP